MKKAVPEQKREKDDRERTHGGPEPETKLRVSWADSDRQRRTSNEFEPSRNGGLVVSLWMLASLIAEIELCSWVFAHMVGA